MKKILSERLRELRESSNLSQNQVALHCNITEKAYQNYELMTREPRIGILIRIADFYGVSLDYLTGRSDTK